MLQVWREQAIPAILNEIAANRQRAERLKMKPFIGCLKLGGLGDFMDLIAFARAVRRKYPRAYVMLLARYFQYDASKESDPINVLANGFRDMPDRAINHVLTMPGFDWPFLVRNMQPFFDVFFDVHYTVGAYYSESYLHESSTHRAECLWSMQCAAPWRSFMDHRFSSNAEFHPNHGDHFEVMSQSSGIRVTADDLWCWCDIAQPTPAGNYVTIHNSAGHAAELKIPQQDVFDAALDACKVAGLKTVQVGTPRDAKMATDVDARDVRSIAKTAQLIRNAVLHVDVEGGLVYIARALGTKCATFFGPTPVFFFGYPTNINLCNGACFPCWWSSQDWSHKPCPKGLRTCANFPLPIQVKDVLLSHFRERRLYGKAM